ncbi:MAG: nucleoside-diphosphate kinase [Promethearchaeota archaeon]
MNEEQERTLVLLKPDAVIRRQVGVNVLKSLMAMPDSRILSFKQIKVSEELARKHYKEHEKKSFFPWLMKMITHPAGVCALIIEGNKIVSRVRELIGPTYVEDAIQKGGNYLRGLYGVTKGVNLVHASDSPISGINESELWKSEASLTMDSQQALEMIKEYINKWDGKFPEKSRDIQSTCAQLRKLSSKLLALLKTETDVDDDALSHLMKVIMETFA